MLYLLDTGILLRLVNPADAQHGTVQNAITVLRQRGDRLHFTSQNLGEFWNVSTRPATSRGGYGLSVVETDGKARLIESLFHLLPDSEAVHVEWRRLLVIHSVSGVKVHDTRLAAAMYVNSVPNILTLNPDDFQRYPGITAIHPGDVT